MIAEDPLFWVVSRKGLAQPNPVEIKLPASGALAVQCDLPGKPAKQMVNIESKSFGSAVWNPDFLRFHFGSYSLKNPGESLFERLPPGRYSVQRQEETKTGERSVLSTGADRKIVEIESRKRARIEFNRSVGKPLSGLVRGLENVELRYARVTISNEGPEETFEDGKRGRLYVAFDVIPIGPDGRFSTDPIPPGEYWADVFAVRADTPKLSRQSSDFSAQVSFTVPEGGDPPKLEIIAKPNAPPDLSKVTDLRVRVVDENGDLLSKVEAMVHTADQGYGLWTAGRNGLAFLGGGTEYRGAALDVLVRADGYASGIAHFAVAQRDKLSKGEAAVTLRRGQKVQLRFNLPDGMKWPTGTAPEVYFDEMQERVRIMRQPSNRRNGVTSDFNMLNLKDVGAGQFEFRLAEDTPPFHVAIHAPGFLQHFETGPFTFADVKNGYLDIDIPRPAALDISFEPGDFPEANSLIKSASLDVMWQIQGDSYLEVASEVNPSLTPRLKLLDLAPGNYMVHVRTQARGDIKPIPGTEINVGEYFDRRKPTLKPGQSERIEFRSTPYDPNAFRGTRDAVVHISAPDGKPAIGRKASVDRFDGHYGYQSVFSGPVPDTGDIVMTGVTDAKPRSWDSYPPYRVSVDDKSLGTFGFTQSSGTERFEFVLPPEAGDMAPDVKLTNLSTGEPISLSSLRGKLVFLEFWATWCGPCQEPMSKLNDLAVAQKVEWKDRVALLPVSIDAEQASVRSHVQERDWTGLNHYWTSGTEGSDFDSPAARAFVVQGVPTAILIGRDGRILWRGHPLRQTDFSDLKTLVENFLK